jgi:hypothetical protein
MTLSTIALSICNGVGGCAQPSSSSLILMYTALQAIMHRAASSALVLDDDNDLNGMCYAQYCPILWWDSGTA